MKHLMSFIKAAFLLVVVGVTTTLGFFGFGDQDDLNSTDTFGDFSLGKIASADHLECQGGTQCSSTASGGDHADCSSSCADSGSGGGGSADGSSCSGAGDGSSV